MGEDREAQAAEAPAHAPPASVAGVSAAAQGSLTALQRAVGNRALGRMLSRQEAPPEVARAIAQAGAALPGNVRGRMERAFGRDFGGVRIHAGPAARAAARAVDAPAFAAGSHIVVGDEQLAHSPQAEAGLAHELAHVAQQPAGTPTRFKLGPRDDPAEREAHAAQSTIPLALSRSLCGELGATARRSALQRFAAEHDRATLTEWRERLGERPFAVRRRTPLGEVRRMGRHEKEKHPPPPAPVLKSGDPGFVGPPPPGAVRAPSPTPAPAPAPKPDPPKAQPSAVVPDVPIPIGFTPVSDNRNVAEIRAQTAAFSGIKELTDFANALVDEYMKLKSPTIDSVWELQKEQAMALEGAVTKPKEGYQDRQKRIKAAGAKVEKPKEDIKVAEEEKAARLWLLDWDWKKHVNSPQTDYVVNKKTKETMWVSTLANAWMRNRQEELIKALDLSKKTAKGQFNFFGAGVVSAFSGDKAESDASVGKQLGEVPGGSNAGDGALVRPETIEFCKALHKRLPAALFGTYKNHGSGPVMGQGLSVDVTLAAHKIEGGSGSWAETTERKFWKRDNAAALVQAIEDTARNMGYGYFAIYNDYAVAKWANERTVYGKVGFAANVDAGKALNYHGGGLKLHLHLDLLPPGFGLAPAAMADAPPPANPDAPTPIKPDATPAPAAPEQ